MNIFNGRRVRKALAGIMMITSILLFVYFIIWCTGVLEWSFNIGMMFILISAVLLLNQSIRLMMNKRYLLLQKFKILRIFVLLFVSIFVLSFSLVEAMVIYSAIHNDDNVKTEYILIPGAEVVKDRPSNIMLTRLEKALVYIRKNPGITIIVSGAKGDGDVYSEAEVMKQFLVNSGIDENRIIKEEEALNSYQNILNTVKIIDNISSRDNSKLMIVTNDYHTFRCKLIAKSLGVNIYGMNVQTHYSVVPICYATEYFSVIKAVMQLFFL